MRRLFAILVCTLALSAIGHTEGFRLGVDVLVAHDFRELRVAPNTRVGLVTNETGRDSTGRRTIDLLASATGLRLTAIFSPEHGLTGSLDTTDIPHSTDATTGVPVYSVYGSTDQRRRPNPSVIQSLDILVFDLQDVGIRFYTYATTLGYFLEAAAAARKPIVVLDRPNPITGTRVEGPLSDPALCPTDACRFVNYHPLPVRHGMTIGELALLFNAERRIHAHLTVMPMSGWRRGDWFDATGLAWIAPSPNLPSPTAATFYGGLGLIEKNNISVGRGTASPFELVGAPWIDPTALSAYLNGRHLRGVRFSPTSFTPTSSHFAHQLCHGVRLHLIDRNSLDVVALGLELAAALHHLYPAEFQLDLAREMLSNDQLLSRLRRGDDPRRLEQLWHRDLQRFRHLRSRYLLY